jgi:hypothetical protein
LRAAVSVLLATANFILAESADPAERIRDMAFSRTAHPSPWARRRLHSTDRRRQQKADRYFNPDEQPAASIELAGASRSRRGKRSRFVAFNSSDCCSTGARDGVASIWAFPAVVNCCASPTVRRFQVVPPQDEPTGGG